MKRGPIFYILFEWKRAAMLEAVFVPQNGGGAGGGGALIGNANSFFSVGVQAPAVARWIAVC